MAESWEKKRGAKKSISLIVIAGVLLICSGIFFVNNRDLFIIKKQEPPAEKKEQAGTAPLTQESAPAHETDAALPGARQADKKVLTGKNDSGKHPPAEVKKDSVINKQALPKKKIKPDSLFSVALPIVECRLAEKKDLVIRVSLKVFFADKNVEQEVLFKRNDIGVILKKVFKNKQLSDIVVDKLREELRRKINALLEKGTIEDIEFIDFKPVSMENPSAGG
jgi:flagellar basal body-associated protein FliL